MDRSGAVDDNVVLQHDATGDVVVLQLANTDASLVAAAISAISRGVAENSTAANFASAIATFGYDAVKNLLSRCITEQSLQGQYAQLSKALVRALGAKALAVLDQRPKAAASTASGDAGAGNAVPASSRSASAPPSASASSSGPPGRWTCSHSDARDLITLLHMVLAAIMGSVRNGWTEPGTHIGDAWAGADQDGGLLGRHPRPWGVAPQHAQDQWNLWPMLTEECFRLLQHNTLLDAFCSISLYMDDKTLVKRALIAVHHLLLAVPRVLVMAVGGYRENKDLLNGHIKAAVQYGRITREQASYSGYRDLSKATLRESVKALYRWAIGLSDDELRSVSWDFFTSMWCQEWGLAVFSSAVLDNSDLIYQCRVDMAVRAMKSVTFEWRLKGARELATMADEAEKAKGNNDRWIKPDKYCDLINRCGILGEILGPRMHSQLLKCLDPVLSIMVRNADWNGQLTTGLWLTAHNRHSAEVSEIFERMEAVLEAEAVTAAKAWYNEVEWKASPAAQFLDTTGKLRWWNTILHFASLNEDLSTAPLACYGASENFIQSHTKPHCSFLPRLWQVLYLIEASFVPVAARSPSNPYVNTEEQLPERMARWEREVQQPALRRADARKRAAAASKPAAGAGASSSAAEPDAVVIDDDDDDMEDEWQESAGAAGASSSGQQASRLKIVADLERSVDGGSLAQGDPRLPPIRRVEHGTLHAVQEVIGKLQASFKPAVVPWMGLEQQLPSWLSGLLSKLRDVLLGTRAFKDGNSYLRSQLLDPSAHAAYLRILLELYRAAPCPKPAKVPLPTTVAHMRRPDPRLLSPCANDLLRLLVDVCDKETITFNAAVKVDVDKHLARSVWLPDNPNEVAKLPSRCRFHTLYRATHYRRWLSVSAGEYEEARANGNDMTLGKCLQAYQVVRYQRYFPAIYNQEAYTKVHFAVLRCAPFVHGAMLVQDALSRLMVDEGVRTMPVPMAQEAVQGLVHAQLVQQDQPFIANVERLPKLAALLYGLAVVEGSRDFEGRPNALLDMESKSRGEEEHMMDATAIADNWDIDRRLDLAQACFDGAFTQATRGAMGLHHTATAGFAATLGQAVAAASGGGDAETAALAGHTALSLLVITRVCSTRATHSVSLRPAAVEGTALYHGPLAYGVKYIKVWDDEKAVDPRTAILSVVAPYLVAACNRHGQDSSAVVDGHGIDPADGILLAVDGPEDDDTVDGLDQLPWKKHIVGHTVDYAGLLKALASRDVGMVQEAGRLAKGGHPGLSPLLDLARFEASEDGLTSKPAWHVDVPAAWWAWAGLNDLHFRTILAVTGAQDKASGLTLPPVVQDAALLLLADGLGYQGPPDTSLLVAHATMPLRNDLFVKQVAMPIFNGRAVVDLCKMSRYMEGVEYAGWLWEALRVSALPSWPLDAVEVALDTLVRQPGGLAGCSRVGLHALRTAILARNTDPLVGAALGVSAEMVDMHLPDDREPLMPVVYGWGGVRALIEGVKDRDGGAGASASGAGSAGASSSQPLDLWAVPAEDKDILNRGTLVETDKVPAGVDIAGLVGINDLKKRYAPAGDLAQWLAHVLQHVPKGVAPNAALKPNMAFLKRLVVSGGGMGLFSYVVGQGKTERKDLVSFIRQALPSQGMALLCHPSHLKLFIRALELRSWEHVIGLPALFAVVLHAQDEAVWKGAVETLAGLAHCSHQNLRAGIVRGLLDRYRRLLLATGSGTGSETSGSAGQSTKRARLSASAAGASSSSSSAAAGGPAVTPEAVSRLPQAARLALSTRLLWALRRTVAEAYHRVMYMVSPESGLCEDYLEDDQDVVLQGMRCHLDDACAASESITVTAHVFNITEAYAATVANKTAATKAQGQYGNNNNNNKVGNLDFELRALEQSWPANKKASCDVTIPLLSHDTVAAVRHRLALSSGIDISPDALFTVANTNVLRSGVYVMPRHQHTWRYGSNRMDRFVHSVEGAVVGDDFTGYHDDVMLAASAIARTPRHVLDVTWAWQDPSNLTNQLLLGPSSSTAGQSTHLEPALISPSDSLTGAWQDSSAWSMHVYIDSAAIGKAKGKGEDGGKAKAQDDLSPEADALLSLSSPKAVRPDFLDGLVSGSSPRRPGESFRLAFPPEPIIMDVATMAHLLQLLAAPQLDPSVHGHGAAAAMEAARAEAWATLTLSCPTSPLVLASLADPRAGGIDWARVLDPKARPDWAGWQAPQPSGQPAALPEAPVFPPSAFYGCTLASVYLLQCVMAFLRPPLKPVVWMAPGDMGPGQWARAFLQGGAFAGIVASLLASGGEAGPAAGPQPSLLASVPALVRTACLRIVATYFDDTYPAYGPGPEGWALPEAKLKHLLGQGQGTAAAEAGASSSAGAGAANTNNNSPDAIEIDIESTTRPSTPTIWVNTDADGATGAGVGAEAGQSLDAVIELEDDVEPTLGEKVAQMDSSAKRTAGAAAGAGATAIPAASGQGDPSLRSVALSMVPGPQQEALIQWLWGQIAGEDKADEEGQAKAKAITGVDMARSSTPAGPVTTAKGKSGDKRPRPEAVPDVVDTLDIQALHRRVSTVATAVSSYVRDRRLRDGIKLLRALMGSATAQASAGPGRSSAPAGPSPSKMTSLDRVMGEAQTRAVVRTLVHDPSGVGAAGREVLLDALGRLMEGSATLAAGVLRAATDELAGLVSSRIDPTGGALDAAVPSGLSPAQHREHCEGLMKGTVHVAVAVPAYTPLSGPHYDTLAGLCTKAMRAVQAHGPAAAGQGDSMHGLLQLGMRALAGLSLMFRPPAVVASSRGASGAVGGHPTLFDDDPTASAASPGGLVVYPWLSVPDDAADFLVTLLPVMETAVTCLGKDVQPALAARLLPLLLQHGLYRPLLPLLGARGGSVEMERDGTRARAWRIVRLLIESEPGGPEAAQAFQSDALAQAASLVGNNPRLPPSASQLHSLRYLGLAPGHPSSTGAYECPQAFPPPGVTVHPLHEADAAAVASLASSEAWQDVLARDPCVAATVLQHHGRALESSLPRLAQAASLTHGQVHQAMVALVQQPEAELPDTDVLTPCLRAMEQPLAGGSNNRPRLETCMGMLFGQAAVEAAGKGTGTEAVPPPAVAVQLVSSSGLVSLLVQAGPNGEGGGWRAALALGVVDRVIANTAVIWNESLARQSPPAPHLTDEYVRLHVTRLLALPKARVALGSHVLVMAVAVLAAATQATVEAYRTGTGRALHTSLWLWLASFAACLEGHSEALATTALGSLQARPHALAAWLEAAALASPMAWPARLPHQDPSARDGLLEDVLARGARGAVTAPYHARRLAVMMSDEVGVSLFDGQGGGRDRPSGGNVGLKNQGATCYMNATLQQLFMLPAIRHGVLVAPEPQQSVLAREKHPDRMRQLRTEMQTVFTALALSSKPYYDPLALVECLENTPPGFFPLESHVRSQNDANEFFLLFLDRLGRLFPQPRAQDKDGQDGQGKEVPEPKPSTDGDVPMIVDGPTGAGAGAGSSSGLVDLTGDEMDESAGAGASASSSAALAASAPAPAPSPSPTPVSDIFTSCLGFKIGHQIIGKGGECSHRRSNYEPTLLLGLDVQGKETLEASLAAYVQGELLAGDNAYLCEACGKKVDTMKRSVLASVPDTLVLHLKRFDMDWARDPPAKMKINDQLRFGFTLDVWPYTAQGLAEAEGEAGAAEAGAKGEDEAGLSEGAARPSSSSSSTDPSVPSLTREQCQFELSGVLVHSGSANAGHYYSIIRRRPGDDAPAAGSGLRSILTSHGHDPASLPPYLRQLLQEHDVGGAIFAPGGTAHAPAALGSVEEGWWEFNDERVEPWDAAREDNRAGQWYGGPKRHTSAFMLFYDRRKSADKAATEPKAGQAGNSSKGPAQAAAPVPVLVPRAAAFRLLRDNAERLRSVYLSETESSAFLHSMMERTAARLRTRCAELKVATTVLLQAMPAVQQALAARGKVVPPGLVRALSQAHPVDGVLARATAGEEARLVQALDSAVRGLLGKILSSTGRTKTFDYTGVVTAICRTLGGEWLEKVWSDRAVMQLFDVKPLAAKSPAQEKHRKDMTERMQRATGTVPAPPGAGPALPSNLPCLEEVLGQAGLGRDEVADVMSILAQAAPAPGSHLDYSTALEAGVGQVSVAGCEAVVRVLTWPGGDPYDATDDTLCPQPWVPLSQPLLFQKQNKAFGSKSSSNEARVAAVPPSECPRMPVGKDVKGMSGLFAKAYTTDSPGSQARAVMNSLVPLLVTALCIASEPAVATAASSARQQGMAIGRALEDMLDAHLAPPTLSQPYRTARKIAKGLAVAKPASASGSSSHQPNSSDPVTTSSQLSSASSVTQLDLPSGDAMESDDVVVLGSSVEGSQQAGGPPAAVAAGRQRFAQDEEAVVVTGLQAGAQAAMSTGPSLTAPSSAVRALRALDLLVRTLVPYLGQAASNPMSQSTSHLAVLMVSVARAHPLAPFFLARHHSLELTAQLLYHAESPFHGLAILELGLVRVQTDPELASPLNGLVGWTEELWMEAPSLVVKPTAGFGTSYTTWSDDAAGMAEAVQASLADAAGMAEAVQASLADADQGANKGPEVPHGGYAALGRVGHFPDWCLDTSSPLLRLLWLQTELVCAMTVPDLESEEAGYGPVSTGAGASSSGAGASRVDHTTGDGRPGSWQWRSFTKDSAGQGAGAASSSSSAVTTTSKLGHDASPFAVWPACPRPTMGAQVRPLLLSSQRVFAGMRRYLDTLNCGPATEVLRLSLPYLQHVSYGNPGLSSVVSEALCVAANAYIHYNMRADSVGDVVGVVAATADGHWQKWVSVAYNALLADPRLQGDGLSLLRLQTGVWGFNPPLAGPPHVTQAPSPVPLQGLQANRRYLPPSPLRTGVQAHVFGASTNRNVVKKRIDAWDAWMRWGYEATTPGLDQALAMARGFGPLPWLKDWAVPGDEQDKYSTALAAVAGPAGSGIVVIDSEPAGARAGASSQPAAQPKPHQGGAVTQVHLTGLLPRVMGNFALFALRQHYKGLPNENDDGHLEVQLLLVERMLKHGGVNAAFTADIKKTGDEVAVKLAQGLANEVAKRGRGTDAISVLFDASNANFKYLASHEPLFNVSGDRLALLGATMYRLLELLNEPASLALCQAMMDMPTLLPRVPTVRHVLQLMHHRSIPPLERLATSNLTELWRRMFGYPCRVSLELMGQEKANASKTYPRIGVLPQDIQAGVGQPEVSEASSSSSTSLGSMLASGISGLVAGVQEGVSRGVAGVVGLLGGQAQAPVAKAAGAPIAVPNTGTGLDSAWWLGGLKAVAMIPNIGQHTQMSKPEYMSTHGAAVVLPELNRLATAQGTAKATDNVVVKAVAHLCHATWWKGWSAEAPARPEDWRELLAGVHEVLQSLGKQAPAGLPPVPAVTVLPQAANMPSRRLTGAKAGNVAVIGPQHVSGASPGGLPLPITNPDDTDTGDEDQENVKQDEAGGEAPVRRYTQDLGQGGGHKVGLAALGYELPPLGRASSYTALTGVAVPGIDEDTDMGTAVDADMALALAGAASGGASSSAGGLDRTTAHLGFAPADGRGLSDPDRYGPAQLSQPHAEHLVPVMDEMPGRQGGRAVVVSASDLTVTERLEPLPSTRALVAKMSMHEETTAEARGAP